ncbi:MAG TPA: GntR family transcriptional regulator [Candidatus Limiplasma stercoravium]|nr:GntR family transcriptional regulator [Candidatus Limiplasma stercoravium]
MTAIDLGDSLHSRPIREVAYETLKHAIVTGEIPAGARIVETEYAQRMHISRTPLREALRKLERDGLVEYMIRRGVVVRAFTIDDVEEIYTIRNALEMLTLPAVVHNATAEDIARLRGMLSEMDVYDQRSDIPELSPRARAFHASLTALSGMRRILAVIESQDEYIRRFSALAIAKESRRHAAHREHHLLVDYVEKRDLDSFEKLMRRHIEHSKQNCLAALEDTRLKRNGQSNSTQKEGTKP